MMKSSILRCVILVVSAVVLAMPVQAAPSSVYIPINRSTMITLTAPATEVVVANPDVADVHVHNPTHISVVAKGLGRTTVHVLNKDRSVMREMEIIVGYDLPAIRKALKNFIPDETIGVEMVNSGIAVTGRVRNAATVDKAMKIVKDFLQQPAAGKASDDVSALDAAEQGAAPAANASSPTVLNFLQVITGQQVMLRVRVGEIQRTALKELGVDLQEVGFLQGSGLGALATGGGIASLVTPAADETAVPIGSFLLPGGQNPTNTRGIASLKWQPNGRNSFSALIKALEQDGLFKLLAEPNLVAVSGEEAEFLSGGEIPVPSVSGSGASATVSVEYKPFGVAVKFRPTVLSENRIHMSVQPEVSEVSSSNAVDVSGFKIPGIDTRRAKTTVELAPGESFMIAGLINDQTKATISQLPGAKDLPVLGALFRSTEFQRNETELVIAVTPYIVDPLKNSDVKLPTDDFRPASQMEMFFFGALGALSGKPDQHVPQTESLEGPTGFMMD